MLSGNLTEPIIASLLNMFHFIGEFVRQKAPMANQEPFQCLASRDELFGA